MIIRFLHDSLPTLPRVSALAIPVMYLAGITFALLCEKHLRRFS